jgi:F-type H+-transporting ATPase subunit epsilon
VRVLADGAEPVSGIDVEAARRRVTDAQERLKSLKSDDARFQVEQATVRRDTARIAAAGAR